jgi:hypothetical protein
MNQQMIADISNLNCWYLQCELSILTIGIVAFMYYWYRQLELSISTIALLIWTIKLSISTMYVHNWYQQFQLLLSVILERNNTNCRYWQLVLVISRIPNADINNARTLLISTIPIVDITNAQSQHYQLSISTNSIIDISNSNCRYQQIMSVNDINVKNFSVST